MGGERGAKKKGKEGHDKVMKKSLCAHFLHPNRSIEPRAQGFWKQ